MFKIKYKSLQTIKSSLNKRNLKLDSVFFGTPCRLCGERHEAVAHIFSECKMLAQKQYKNWRHDKIAQVIHWELCKKYNMDYAEKWYEHKPESVGENENAKIL